MISEAQEKDRKYFIQNAPCLFGRYWKTGAAKYFEKSLNTILNWNTGRTPVPHIVINLLQANIAQGARYNIKNNKMEIIKNAPKRKS